MRATSCEQFSILPSVTFSYFCSIGRFEEEDPLVKRVLDDYQLYGDKIQPNRKLHTDYNFALFYFGAANFENSLLWLNKVLDFGLYRFMRPLFLRSILRNKPSESSVIAAIHRWEIEASD